MYLDYDFRVPIVHIPHDFVKNDNPKGVFRLGVRDSSFESINTILVIKDLNFCIMKILC
jgi:hypothetical protein